MDASAGAVEPTKGRCVIGDGSRAIACYQQTVDLAPWLRASHKDCISHVVSLSNDEPCLRSPDMEPAVVAPEENRLPSAPWFRA